MAYPGPPRRAGGIARYLIVGILLCSVLFYYRHEAQTAALNSHYLDSYLDSTHPHDSPQNPHVPTVPGPKDPLAGKGQQIEKLTEKPIEQSEDVATHPRPQAAKPVEPALQPVDPVTNSKPSIHPIDTLIKGAENTFQGLLKKESHDLASAAAEYRRRRGRHPPPGFDKWFEFAQKHNAVMVEDFFDQIYHDLTPYWGLPASTLRKESWDYDMVINIRNGNSSTTSNWFWTQIWLNMTQTIQHLLPDMDIPLNAMDEPRILVPWEEVNQYMKKEKETRKMPPAHQVISEFHRLDAPGEGDKDKDVQTRDKDWEEVFPFWKIVTRGCPPDSLARKAEVATDFSKTPAISLAHTTLHSYKGYVSNFSLAIDPCHQPDLQNLHGMMINPLSVRSTKVLAPMFGGSKLPMNNEILLPAPMYWTDEERFSGGNDHGEGWGTKKDKVVWRGVATGGRNKAENWRGFQRHRFVAMTNGTQVSGAESWQMIPENWALPSSQYDLAAQQDGKLGKWVGEWSDTGFVDLMCHGPQPPNTTCSYTGSYFSIAKGMKMGDQFDRKYLPDIDGNSFSGRYRGFLMSTSLPIKATIFKEWHDSRLIAWKHFVPMDNRFMDFYGIMQYFLGYKSESITIPSHDAEAERIALAGQEWANRVLRKEDMQIYTLRLLLEFARLSDDKREMMGWVQDLL